MSDHTIDHTSRKHALLSASGSSRWLTCTPSARLEDKIADKQSSVYAEEGTLAHELSEAKLRLLLGIIDKAQYKALRAELTASELYSESMDEYVEDYVDYCISLYNDVLKVDPNAVASVEEKFDLSEIVPDSFGSCDFDILSFTKLYITDLKFGKGVKVNAENNPQLMLYALGSYLQNSLFAEIDTVIMTVVQPRLNHTSTFEMSAKDLLAWAQSFVKPRAALAFEGKGEFVAGDHCRFCKVKAKCKAFADMNLQIAKYEFAEPGMLSDDELLHIYSTIDMFTVWVNSVKEHIQTEAIKNGKKWPGYKLVEGRSNRKVNDEDALVSDLLVYGLDEDDLYKKKLVGITELTKLLGTKDFKKWVEPFLTKPTGAPTLVPESDKRPELNSTEAAINDFK